MRRRSCRKPREVRGFSTEMEIGVRSKSSSDAGGMLARRHRFGMVLRGLALGLCLWLIAAPPLAALGNNEIRERAGR